RHCGVSDPASRLRHPGHRRLRHRQPDDGPADRHWRLRPRRRRSAAGNRRSLAQDPGRPADGDRADDRQRHDDRDHVRAPRLSRRGGPRRRDAGGGPGAGAAGRPLLGGAPQPLLLERQVGAGTVTLASFDWNQDPVAGWSGTAPLLRQLIARSVIGTGSANQNFAYAMGASGPMGFGSQQPTIASKSGALSSTLGNLPGLDLPSLQLTGLLVLLYVLLVGPVNYVVLGAMRRRALAWVTVPLIAVIAAGGAYGAGVFTKGRSVQANQITILHVQPGWDHAYQETYTGIMAPSRGDYQATISGGRLLISPIVNNGGF